MSEHSIRHLQVLPSRSSDLCFNIPGVISVQNFNHQTKLGPAYIGQTVQSFDPTSQLYINLAETITNTTDPRYPGDPSARLKYDSAEIHKALAVSAGGTAPFLFGLRNESIGAMLDQAIARREGMYFERFKHGPAIQAAMTNAFPKILNYLKELQQDASDRFTAINAEYNSSGASPVVTQTKSTTSANNQNVRTTTRQRNIVSVNGEFDDPTATELDTRTINELETDSSKKHTTTQKSDRLAGFPFAYDRTSSGDKWKLIEDDFVDEAQISDTKTTGDQVTAAENPAFFHPKLDNVIGNKQLQTGLLNEELNQTLASLTAPHMDRIVADERAATDFEVRRLQITFAETYLTSPINGVVTAMFKDIGECVQPGEPVMRVENDAVVFLAGRMQYFGLLRIGQDVTVRASDLYEAGVSSDFPGRIRGIRGHQADDDEWEVLIECDNPADAQGRRKLPIYYQFDRDTTKIVVP